MRAADLVVAKTNAFAADTSNRMRNTEQAGWIVERRLGGGMQGVAQSSRGEKPARSQPSRFVEHMQQLFGEDPDPVLLEESWALGIAAAVDNHDRRRRQRADVAGEFATYTGDRAVRELERMAALGGDVEGFLAERSQPMSSRYSPAWIERAQTDPAGIHADEDAVQSVASFRGTGTTDAHATLGVPNNASREEIRSAYRRKVGECHPDRLQDASETVRRRATQQLVAVNAAYRALCEQLCDAA
jgi:DnaJ-domain-containing protein 1